MNELDRVVLTRSVDEAGLQRGDVGTVVHVYADETGYEIEFLTADGETLAVLTLAHDDIRPMQGRELLHVRSLA